mmetsp:Transcript_56305/g.99442  ORF Transcript_56305/g.99442 Transcript_56305/m.99442 type:complete len:81 (+) Transcript_56305:730-972(+)
MRRTHTSRRPERVACTQDSSHQVAKIRYNMWRVAIFDKGHTQLLLSMLHDVRAMPSHRHSIVSLLLLSIGNHLGTLGRCQ